MNVRLVVREHSALECRRQRREMLIQKLRSVAVVFHWWCFPALVVFHCIGGVSLVVFHWWCFTAFELQPFRFSRICFAFVTLG